MPDSSTIVSKVWNYAHVLKNAGVGYGPAAAGSSRSPTCSSSSSPTR